MRRIWVRPLKNITNLTSIIHLEELQVDPDDQKFQEFIKEADIISNYLRQQISNGSIQQELYKQNILRFLMVYEAFENSN